jgi:hypothetical protein
LGNVVSLPMMIDVGRGGIMKPYFVMAALSRASWCAALLFFASFAQARSQDKIPSEVINQAALHGTALVLVGLSVPWEMESNLDGDALRAQRTAIASIQNDLLTQLEGRSYKIVRRYQEIPGIALEVGADALAELARLPIVTNVLLDRLPGAAEWAPNFGSARTEPPSTRSVDPVAEKVPSQLFKRAASNGTVLVLAGLRTPWQREELLSESLRTLQRAAIQDAQSYILAELAGTTFRVTRLYRSIPGIALRVGVDALKVLESSPAITNVVQDRPAQSSR